MIQSPLNYTGGKFKLLPQLPSFPNNIHTFVDLFCGGCNVGINVKAQKHIYNDTNRYLLYLYNTLKIMIEMLLLRLFTILLKSMDCPSLANTDMIITIAIVAAVLVVTTKKSILN